MFLSGVRVRLSAVEVPVKVDKVCSLCCWSLSFRALRSLFLAARVGSLGSFLL